MKLLLDEFNSTLILHSMRRGDVVVFKEESDEEAGNTNYRNMTMLIYDGEKVAPLAFEADEYGHLPYGFFLFKEFPPSYFFHIECIDIEDSIEDNKDTLIEQARYVKDTLIEQARYIHGSLFTKAVINGHDFILVVEQPWDSELPSSDSEQPSSETLMEQFTNYLNDLVRFKSIKGETTLYVMKDEDCGNCSEDFKKAIIDDGYSIDDLYFIRYCS